MELIRDKVYRIRLTDGHWTNGKFLYERKTARLRSRTMTHFIFENLATGRTIEIKSRVRIKEIV